MFKLTNTKAQGFSLVELLVVLAIVAILYAIVLPNYTAYTFRTNRSYAMTAMNEIMQAQERFAADQGTYTTDLTDLGYALVSAVPAPTAADAKYRITASACGGGIAECVLLTAVAEPHQANDDNGFGGDITYNSQGTKTGLQFLDIHKKAGKCRLFLCVDVSPTSSHKNKIKQH